MGELMQTQKATAARRGWMAVGGWAVTGWALVGGHVFFGLALGAAAVWLTRRWFNYRASWGMRF